MMLILFDGDGAARQTLRFIEEKAGIGVWIWNLPSGEMEWSTGVYHLLGLEPGAVEPSYALIMGLAHPDDRMSDGELDRIITEGLPIDREFRVIQHTGRVKWVAIRGEILFDPSGHASRIVGLLVDISARQEAIYSAQASDERYRALVKAMGAIAWTARSDGAVAELTAWRELTGQTSAEMRGFGWINALHPDDRPLAQEAWARALEQRKPYGCEYRVRVRDGDYRWFASRATPVFNRDGSVREWVGITLDIQAQKTNPTLYPHDEDETRPLLTGTQIRAARGVLNWSVRDLAEAAEVSASTIRRLEELNGAPGTREDKMDAIRAALEGAGVEFLFPTIGKPGVRPR